MTYWRKTDSTSSEQYSPKHDPMISLQNNGPDNEPSALECVAIAESLANTPIESLETEADEEDFLRRLSQCASKIGENSESSRAILSHLIKVAKQIRDYSSSASDGYQPLTQELIEWSEEISTISYRWTTFQLLQSSSQDDSSGHGTCGLRDKWTTFQKTSVLDMLHANLKKGAIRAVSILWSRHLCDEVISGVCDLLRSIPSSLPVAVYQPWVQQEVIPALVGYADATGWSNRGSSSSTSAKGRGDLLKEFAKWVLKRAELAAANGDLQTGIRLCSLLMKNADNLQGELSSESFFFKFKLQTADTQPTETPSREQHRVEDPIDQIEQLHRKLVHIKRLAEQHKFKISLSLFNDETPATIAMSMLDRAQTAELLKDEIEIHVKRYLGFCEVSVDPVLSEYVIELAESIQTSESKPTDEMRALTVLRAISGMDIRANAALAVLRSVVPPYSEGIKAFAYDVALAWNSRRQEEIEEHVRLMKIQDMLTTYGVKHFSIDSRNATRLVGHILTQITRPSAIYDAMLLVDAYSQLQCDRVVVQYSENLLSFSSPAKAKASPSALSAEMQTRVSLAVAALAEVKKRNTEKLTMPVLSVMDEVVAFGIELLESDEREHEHKRLHAMKQLDANLPLQGNAMAPSTGSHSFVLFMLESLVAAYLPEAHSLSEIALSMRDDAAVAFVSSDEFLLRDELLSDLQKLRRIESDYGILLSMKTLRDREACEAKLKHLMQPEILFASETSTAANQPARAGQPPFRRRGNGKKRVAATAHGDSNGGEDAKRVCNWDQEAGSASVSLERHNGNHGDQQVSDGHATLFQELSRFAAAVGIPARSYQAMIAQQAAQHGSMSRAVRYARDLFARRRVVDSSQPPRPHSSPRGSNTTRGMLPPADSAEILRRIAVAISGYTATHVDDIYSAMSAAHPLNLPSPTLARLRAPMFAHELLQYSICVCDIAAFEETLVLLKSAALLNDALQATQLDLDVRRSSQWRIYTKWFRGDATILPCDQVMKLATRFAIAEHGNLIHGDERADTISSKRFISFLVEQRADLLSLQAIMAMRALPEDAAGVVQAQEGKLLSTVFQSQEIDSRLALGYVLLPCHL